MAWDKNKPAGTDKIRNSDNYIRDNWAALEDSLGPSLKMGLGSQIIWLYADSIAGETASLWSIIAAAGDRLLAVKGGTTYTTGQTSAGTWVQPSHTLTKAEIPPHTHLGNDVNRSNFDYTSASVATGKYAWYYGAPGTGFVTENGAADGLAGAAHYHGNTYRPAAYVGLLIQKS